MAAIKPTKEQFQEYVDIRNSGVTNMWDVRTIEKISTAGITRNHCFYIMENFEELAKEYKVEV